MKHVFGVRVGPVTFRIGSVWREPITQLQILYRDYPQDNGVPDFTVRLAPLRAWRRWIRPAVTIEGDFAIPDAAPLPLDQGLLAAEMGMNLQMALGQRRFLLLHAAAVERDGRAIVLTGESGAGKSTLAALLQGRGWRLMADEFVLLDLASGMIHPFPRPVSLKNDAIEVVAKSLRHSQWGPLISDTPKGTIRHLVPQANALAGAEQPARPILLLFPRFGAAPDQRVVGAGEAFVRLTQASTNYVGLGERGFLALTGLVSDVTRVAIDYPDADTAAAMIEALW
ncbi:HprK-related kinase A [Sphingomonas sp. IC4-52]|uniref:HprK-related kinase A n=1 Tax=Sphingomonas sp. IC4-52 TaxID=2887202 RepID=UPI001D130206|nr:HprK-related kinase A [Sphingomonas sp. IC4-52]MCC2978797.1 HprK-related kinase A [Sphingomonas sp. IC4-52]